MTANNSPQSMRTFFIIWLGQMVSMIGSGLTGFGLAFARRSDEASDKIIFRRIQNKAALDKAVRRPLQPD